MKNQTIFELAKRFLSPGSGEDEKQAFESLLEEIERRGEEPEVAYLEQAKAGVFAKVTSIRKRKKKLRQILISSRQYAASVLVIGLVFLAIHFFTRPQLHEPEWIVKTTEIGMRSTITLNDGTMVRLNENSKLEFPEFFDSSERVVKLYGEAYFDVTSDRVKPFKVISNQTEVTVLGTIFNVNTFQATEVTVASGSVKVADTLSKDNVLLTPGQQAVLQESEIVVSQVNPDFYIGWHTRKLQFDSLPAEEVFHVLERAYGVTIALDKSSKKVNCLITGRYEGERIETIMKGLTHILDFTYETDVSTKTITLTIKQCKN
ncbi:FecR family protein [Lunatibacter salilacus]|uniref:FecR family protein n=1 Tax=Lunatibacter salilacus TaxID=2483804 RepID=UPI00131D564F|nr:FecR domain-containing protein [Lunatibacter salilacus]